jgi:hypothetical protein
MRKHRTGEVQNGKDRKSGTMEGEEGKSILLAVRKVVFAEYVYLKPEAKETNVDECPQ